LPLTAILKIDKMQKLSYHFINFYENVHTEISGLYMLKNSNFIKP